MRWQTWVLASLLLGSSAGGQAVESPAGGAKSAAQTAIFGHWRLVGASVNVPVDCRHSMLHITPDGYLAEQSQSPDGELFSFRAKAKIRQEGSRYLVTLGAPQHNGKPDCLGNSANKIETNFLPQMHLQVSGNRLYHYLGPNSEQGYLRYVRQPLAPVDSLRASG